jgi:hypothetical protein
VHAAGVFSHQIFVNFLRLARTPHANGSKGKQFTSHAGDKL